MVRRATRAHSVLKRQKPKARSQRNLIKRGLIGLCLSGITVVGLYYWHASPTLGVSPEFSHQKATIRAKNLVEPWRIDIRNDGSQPLDDSLIIKMRSSVQNELSASSPSFEHIAQLIQKMGSFTSVRIAHTGRRSLVVQVSPRVPSLCIEADQTRFIGTDGSVYGSPASLDECPGPVVRGILDIVEKRTFHEDATLTLNIGEQSAIQDALNLQKSLNSHDLHPTSILYTKHRGFTVTLKGKTPEITVGYPPFDERMAKLVSLLDKLASKGEDALRIELDYQGKAFLKLKKM